MNCNEPTHLMPNAEKGCAELKHVFNDHLFRDSGYPWTLTAAISGAHTLGSAKPLNSKYDGFWSDMENSGKFNNNYYHAILAKGWVPEKMKGGKTQWARADIGIDPDHKEMMLTTDMCLAFKFSPQISKCVLY